MLKIIFLLAVVFVMAKDPVSLQPDIQTPDINKKDEIDLKKYKDVELKKEDTKGQPLCTSEAGVEYKPGTESYASCMRERDRYTPPGYNLYKKNRK